jgi:methane/ammonia monooxygenase subunit C
MSFITGIMPGRATAATASDQRPIADLRPMWGSIIALCVLFVGARIYEQAFGWNSGMDSNSREFQLGWMTILYIAITLEAVALIALVGYLWTTRDHDLASVAPREELRRMFTLFGWIMLYGLAFVWGASYFTEQDATWHSAAIRDSAFTPVNIIKYYVSYPVYIIIGIGGFMYARTRVPIFGTKGFSVAYALFVVGPFMILPSAALSEWGCTFWYMEELFVAPLHWTFVFFGWFSLAVFGVSLQILGRLVELTAGDAEIAGAGASIAE